MIIPATPLARALRRFVSEELPEPSAHRRKITSNRFTPFVIELLFIGFLKILFQCLRYNYFNNRSYFDNGKFVQRGDHQLIHNRSRSFFQTLLLFLYPPVWVESAIKVKLQQSGVLLEVVAGTFDV